MSFSIITIRSNFIKALLFITTLFSSSALAGETYQSFPKHIDAKGKYVFYSHGFIVEGTNPRPVDKRWGIYEFPDVKKALSDDDYHLIAYHRAKNTDPFEHARKLASNVEELLKHGVKTNNITIVGFSRGAFITALTSHNLEKTPVNTVLLAGCGRIVSSKYAHIKANGNLLSIYETTDGAGTCRRLQERSDKLNSFREFSISTGEEHGAFYRPMPAWVNPLKQWIKSNGTNTKT